MTLDALPERLRRRIEVSDETGCWMWTGRVDKCGYGRTSIKSVAISAHLLVWIILKGKPPKGLELDHLCHSRSPCKGGNACPHRRCCNPDHLELKTHHENMLGSERAMRQECINHHPYTAENTRIYVRRGVTTRVCRTCEKEAWERYYDRQRTLVGAQP